MNLPTSPWANCADNENGHPVFKCLPGYCGNGILEGTEECDDGNNVPGEGCNGWCLLEVDYACLVEGERCIPINCGDTIVDANEECDDGN